MKFLFCGEVFQILVVFTIDGGPFAQQFADMTDVLIFGFIL